MSVRKLYEKVLASSIRAPNLEGMIEKFDKDLPHSNDTDLIELKNAISKQIARKKQEYKYSIFRTLCYNVDIFIYIYKGGDVSCQKQHYLIVVLKNTLTVKYQKSIETLAHLQMVYLLSKLVQCGRNMERTASMGEKMIRRCND
ncbi:hypothetical protein BN166_300004 [Clostridioides difficile E10]|nr:hypothetical protein BN166_300004 [Clostridioides difficile E10]